MIWKTSHHPVLRTHTFISSFCMPAHYIHLPRRPLHLPGDTMINTCTLSTLWGCQEASRKSHTLIVDQSPLCLCIQLDHPLKANKEDWWCGAAILTGPSPALSGTPLPLWVFPQWESCGIILTHTRTYTLFSGLNKSCCHFFAFALNLYLTCGKDLE